ncbi:MAG: aminomethyl-transferring glycine dehydrogenase subunit GcvPA [Candidatus Marinimicrobia bacterium]|nr:aminomethyl-transferring glycine dehydrogenase subunit GcvPA [Candidatus Neomarinimicrobiota bacterium]
MSYIPNTDSDREKMLKDIGVDKFEDLLKSIPQVLKSDIKLSLPKELSELEIEKEISQITTKNSSIEKVSSFLGGGVYNHFIPKVVDYIISRPEFATAYTPYQAEVSQGTLQAMYEFQTMISELTQMDVTNASMYDGATAMAESAMMAKNITRKNKIIVSETVNPNYIKVLETYCEPLNIELIKIKSKNFVTDIDEIKKILDKDVAGVIMQSPNFFGYIEEMEKVSEILQDTKALFIASVDAISLALLKPPGSYDADIVIGEGQMLGNHLNFGGPYLGLFSTRKKYIRKMPGRIVGATKDSNGKDGFVLTLQTREQHIRREKATSNICSNEGLNAMATTIYLSLMGNSGMKKIANLCLQKSHYLFENIQKIDGFSKVTDKPFFKEFVIKTPIPAKEIIEKANRENIFAGIPLDKFYASKTHELLIAVTEKNSKKEIDEFLDFLSRIHE